ncbi:TetR/AcrR family transcriptional regulator [Lysinibacter sp. HNR]|uniref:TetR/AcrR family transcriptional regulator n=1 Tax=Lysinibacter sp. HNR TaxID=3031408 RepID=UPI0024352330|nr:TetR/AcrR family transcriptional regulator [Lysinibacter sp. HNR]WGD37489.1 TetR/AcrR family transcriptional regulator [Lysinibacter sp. HNR]
MERNPERTQARLLEAATAEFSAHGLAGGRVDRIAKNAGVNKERIYQYFSNKEGLFSAVLDHQLSSIIDEVPLDGSEPEDIVHYARALYTYHSNNPVFSRLLHWEGLELDPSAALIRCEQQASQKMDQFMTVFPHLTRTESANLLLTILTLANSWSVLHNLGAQIFGNPAPPQHEAIESVVRALINGYQNRTSPT